MGLAARAPSPAQAANKVIPGKLAKARAAEVRATHPPETLTGATRRHDERPEAVRVLVARRRHLRGIDR